jgi:hypothetical protein
MALHDWTKNYPGVQRLLQQPDDVLDYGEEEEGACLPGRAQTAHASAWGPISAMGDMPQWRSTTGRLVHAARIARCEQRLDWEVNWDEESEGEMGRLLHVTITWHCEGGGMAMALAPRTIVESVVGTYLLIEEDASWSLMEATTFEATHTRVDAASPRTTPREGD